MNFNEMTYHDFCMDRTSRTTQSKTPIHFTKEEIEWAIQQTEYEYSGDCEFTDQQKMAVDIMVWYARSIYNDPF